MDDYGLAKLSLAQKVKDLCLQFMRETHKDKLYLKVRPSGEAALTFDSQGKTCVGDAHSVQVMAWTDDEFEAFLSMPEPHFVDDDDYEDDD